LSSTPSPGGWTFCFFEELPLPADRVRLGAIPLFLPDSDQCPQGAVD
jgi:hypothetical protein